MNQLSTLGAAMAEACTGRSKSRVFEFQARYVDVVMRSPAPMLVIKDDKVVEAIDHKAHLLIVDMLKDIQRLETENAQLRVRGGALLRF